MIFETTRDFTILKHLVQYFLPLYKCKLGFWTLLWIGALKAHTPPAPEEPFLCLEKDTIFLPFPHLVQTAIYDTLYHMPEFFAITIVLLLFSVIVHEVMHGLVALKFGDHTAERAGRLTLNPIPHIDLVGTILLPGLLIISGSPILFGWAKPVPVNPLNFSNLRKGELLVSAAGILSNFGLAIIFALVYHFLDAIPVLIPALVGEILRYGVYINLILGVFNLLPIPPLDGSKVLLSQLPYNLAKEYQKMERYGILILLILLMVPFGRGSLLQTILGFFVGILTRLLGF